VVGREPLRELPRLNRLERMPEPRPDTPSAPPLAAKDPLSPAAPRAPSPTIVAPAHSSPRVDFDVDVRWWFDRPCNRFVCWNDRAGFQFGYVFCDSRIFSYWWRPGCDPCFTPYSYYWQPSCYYLPAYYPSYATVRVVHDYYSDGPIYSSYGTSAAASDAAPAATSADLPALLAAGWEQFRTGSYPDAAESFRQALLAAPDDVEAKMAFAQTLFALGNYGDAAFLFRRVVELRPDWPVVGEDPRSRYADPLDHAEQLVALRAFLEHVPGEPAATLVLGVQNYFTGDLTAAREAFQALALLDPEDLVAQRFLERLGPAPAHPARPAAPAAPVGR